MTPARAPHGHVCPSSRRTTRSNFLQSGSQVGIMCLSIMAEFWESARRGFRVSTFSPYFKSGLGESYSRGKRTLRKYASEYAKVRARECLMDPISEN